MKAASLAILTLAVLLLSTAPSSLSQEALPPQPLDLAAIQVHAIAWAAEPAERIAAVDDRILREGMHHRGATVVEIRPYSVVFGVAGRLLEKEIREDGDASEASAASSPTPDGEASPEPAPPAADANAGGTFPRPGLTTAELSNIRSAPEGGAEVLMRVPVKTPLEITGAEGGWLRLRLRDGGAGWIHRSLVHIGPAP